MDHADFLGELAAIGARNAALRADYHVNREKLIEYLMVKVKECDWHGVSDAANDLRVMEARHEAR